MLFVFSMAALALLIFVLQLLSNITIQWRAAHFRNGKRNKKDERKRSLDSEDTERQDWPLITHITSISNELNSYKEQQHQDERARACREIIVLIVGVIAAACAGFGLDILWSIERDAGRPATLGKMADDRTDRTIGTCRRYDQDASYISTTRIWEITGAQRHFFTEARA